MDAAWRARGFLKCSRNAQRNTGPRTAANKRAVARNAVTHGALSPRALPGDDVETFEALPADMWEALQPLGELEGILADRVVQRLWRLQRFGLVESRRRRRRSVTRRLPPPRLAGRLDVAVSVRQKGRSPGDSAKQSQS